MPYWKFTVGSQSIQLYRCFPPLKIILNLISEYRVRDITDFTKHTSKIYVN